MDECSAMTFAKKMFVKEVEEVCYLWGLIPSERESDILRELYLRGFSRGMEHSTEIVKKVMSRDNIKWNET